MHPVLDSFMYTRFMSALDEMEEEDLRFRSAIKSAAYECDGDLQERVEELARESKAKQRAILEKYNPELRKKTVQ